MENWRKAIRILNDEGDEILIAETGEFL